MRFPNNRLRCRCLLLPSILLLGLVSWTHGQTEVQQSTRRPPRRLRHRRRRRRRLFSYTINNELESTYDPPPRVIMDPFRLTLSNIDALLSDQNREVLLERMETVATNFLRDRPVEDNGIPTLQYVKFGGIEQEMMTTADDGSDLLVNVDVGVASYENHPTPSNDQVQQWVEQALASDLVPSLQTVPDFSDVKSIDFALQSDPIGGTGDGTSGTSNAGATGGGGEITTGEGGAATNDGTLDPSDFGTVGEGGATTTDGTSDGSDSGTAGEDGERTTGTDPSVDGSGGETSTNGTSDTSVDGTSGGAETNGEASASDGSAPTSDENKATETEIDTAASSKRRLAMWIILGVSLALFCFGLLFLGVAKYRRRRELLRQGGGIVHEVPGNESLPAAGTDGSATRGGKNGASHLDTRSVADESESEWTVATEAGDSMAIKSIHPTGSALAMTPNNPTTSELAMSESFERDRQVAISKDMLTGKWSGNLTNPSGKAAGNSESVLQPSHFTAATEEQEREARAAVTPDLEASSMGSSTTDGSAGSSSSGSNNNNKQPRCPHPPDDDDE